MQFVPDKTYMSDLDAYIQKLQSGLLSEDQAAQVAKFANNTVGSRLSASGGKLDGPAYQQAGTELGNAISKWGKDSTTEPMSNALSDYQTIFDNAARRNSDPAAVTLLDNADTGWAKYVRLRNAAARGGVKKEDGTFSPTDLLGAVKQEAGGVKSGAYLRGDALSQDYANSGRGLIDTLPNSGTSERLMTGQALGGGLGAATGAGSAIASNPGVLAPFAVYAPGVNKAVTRFMAPREATLSPEIAAILSDMAGKVKDRRGMFGNAFVPAAVGYATSP
jgi:hypothetical protein